MPTSPRFLHAHATHPHGELAVELAWAQLASQGAQTMGASLGWVYITEDLASQASMILTALRGRLPGVAWVGAVGVGVLASGVEYLDEPAVAIMLCNFPTHQFRVFNGLHPLPPQKQLGWRSKAAQVHADARNHDLPELLAELAGRTDSGQLYGGLSSGHNHTLHLALPGQAPDTESGLWEGGVSGVAFSEQIALLTKVTQGCIPIGPERVVTMSDRNVIHTLNDEPALTCLLRDIGVTSAVGAPDWQREALPRLRHTLVGYCPSDQPLTTHGAHLSDHTMVRHLVGLDPAKYGIAVGDWIDEGMSLAFCQRSPQAARQDLIRLCAEIKDELTPEDGPERHILGAVYVSCASRGGRYFGAPNAEMALIQHALGDIPIVGFLAGGEIARDHLFSYTGVLTVFTAPIQQVR